MDKKCCPFCGSEAVLDWGYALPIYTIRCKNPNCIAHMNTMTYRSAEEAIEVWNSRFIDPSDKLKCIFTLEYDKEEVERRKKAFEEDPLGLFPQDMPDSCWTCSNCGVQYKCHYDKYTSEIIPIPDWMKCCPECGAEIQKG